MTRSPEDLANAAAAAERWLDSLDPEAISSPEADASDLRVIGRLGVAVAQDNAALAKAVEDSRAKGRTWTQIAAMLGVTRQAARERFGTRTSV